MAVKPDYSVLDRAGAARTAFYPRPDRSTPPAGASDHLFEVAPGIHLGARFYLRDLSFPTVVYFHGNGEVAGDHDDIAPMYFAIGANLLVVEFRGYGRSNGEPNFETLVADAGVAARLAHDLLDSRGCTGARFVMGRSMGAHSALEIAANAPDGFLGMILESGAGNMRRWMDRPDLPVEMRQFLADHEAKIRSIQLPVLMIHGERDNLIPLDRAREVYEMLEGTDRNLLVIAGAGHNDILWLGRQEYLAAVRDFVARCIELHRNG